MKTRFNFVIFITFFIAIIIASIVLGVSACKAYASETVNVKIIGTYDYEASKEVLKIVNEERAKRGLAPLSFDSELQKAANKRVAEAAIYFSHDRACKNTANNDSCFEVYPINRGGYYGENVAVGSRTPSDVMENWMNSEGHRQNILDSRFKYIGISCYATNGGYVWVQAFQSVGNQSEAPVSGKTTQDISVLQSRVKLVESNQKLQTGDVKDIKVLGINAGWSGIHYEIDMSTVTLKSSNTKVVQINDKKQLVATGHGTATVTISVSGKSAKIHVTVEDKIEGIKLNKTELTLMMGKDGGAAKETLQATIYPSTAEKAKVTWQIKDCSQGTYIIVGKDNGAIYAYAPGTATVVASLDNGMTATCKLTVIPYKDSSNLEQNNTSNPIENTITANNSSTNNTTAKPSDTNTTATNNSEASSAVKPSNSNTTATNNSEASSIVKPSDTNTTASNNSSTSSTVKPADTNNTTNNIEKSNDSNNIAKPTDTNNTTTNNNMAKPTTPSVEMPTSLVVQNPNKTIKIHVGEKHCVLAYAYPAPTQRNAGLTFTASDTSIASLTPLDEFSAAVVGKKAGTMTVTVRTANGLVDTCKIIVIDGYFPGYVSIIGSLDQKFKVGDVYKIKAIIDPVYATDKNIKYESSDPSIAQVDSNGNVTFKKEGSCKIYAYTYLDAEHTGRTGQYLNVTVTSK